MLLLLGSLKSIDVIWFHLQLDDADDDDDDHGGDAWHTLNVAFESDDATHHIHSHNIGIFLNGFSAIINAIFIWL